MNARLREIWLLVRGEDERGRKLRWLLGLLRPYRRKVALMFGALIVHARASAPRKALCLAISEACARAFDVLPPSRPGANR